MTSNSFVLNHDQFVYDARKKEFQIELKNIIRHRNFEIGCVIVVEGRTESIEFLYIEKEYDHASDKMNFIWRINEEKENIYGPIWIVVSYRKTY